MSRDIVVQCLIARVPELPQLAGRRCHIHIGNDVMLAPSLASLMSNLQYPSDKKRQTMCSDNWVKTSIFHKRGMIGLEADICWLFDEDCLRDSGII